MPKSLRRESIEYFMIPPNPFIPGAIKLFGIINIVFFSPEDLNIIKNGPAERRRFIDLELSQLDKVYLSDLSNYNRIVNQRNKLLKDIYTNYSLTKFLRF